VSAHDSLLPSETSARPFYDNLGTADEFKRLSIIDTDHSVIRLNQVIGETLDWFDRYLGPVKQ